jgi:hypothetical protein
MGLGRGRGRLGGGELELRIEQQRKVEFIGERLEGLVNVKALIVDPVAVNFGELSREV